LENLYHMQLYGRQANNVDDIAFDLGFGSKVYTVFSSAEKYYERGTLLYRRVEMLVTACCVVLRQTCNEHRERFRAEQAVFSSDMPILTLERTPYVSHAIHLRVA
jgi:hypothetical protein